MEQISHSNYNVRYFQPHDVLWKNQRMQTSLSCGPVGNTRLPRVSPLSVMGMKLTQPPAYTRFTVYRNQTQNIYTSPQNQIK